MRIFIVASERAKIKYALNIGRLDMFGLKVMIIFQKDRNLLAGLQIGQKSRFSGRLAKDQIIGF